MAGDFPLLGNNMWRVVAAITLLLFGQHTLASDHGPSGQREVSKKIFHPENLKTAIELPMRAIHKLTTYKSHVSKSWNVFWTSLTGKYFTLKTSKLQWSSRSLCKQFTRKLHKNRNFENVKYFLTWPTGTCLPEIWGTLAWQTKVKWLIRNTGSVQILSSFLSGVSSLGVQFRSIQKSFQMKKPYMWSLVNGKFDCHTGRFWGGSLGWGVPFTMPRTIRPPWSGDCSPRSWTFKAKK